MKINSLITYNTNVQNKSKNTDLKTLPVKTKPTISFSGNDDDSVIYYENCDFIPAVLDVIGIKEKLIQKKENKIFDQFLKREGKVSVKEYENICKKYPFILEKAREMVIEDSYAYTTPTQIAKFALNTKNYLDNCERLRGKEYTIVSIGTSPTPLTETLDNLGCNVTYIPISGLRFCTENNTVEKNENLKLALEYLKEKCSKNDKNMQYVVIDYAFSGRTLRTISNLMSKDDYITKEENIWDISLSQLLSKVFKSNEVPLEKNYEFEDLEKFFEEYDDDLYCSDFTPLGNVPHFYLADEKNEERLGSVFSKGKTKEELFKEFDNYSRPLARCFNLCTLNVLNLMGEIK